MCESVIEGSSPMLLATLYCTSGRLGHRLARERERETEVFTGFTGYGGCAWLQQLNQHFNGFDSVYGIM